MKHAVLLSVLALIIFCSLVGCSFFDNDHKQNPTTPSEISAESLANCYTIGGNGNGYGIYKKLGLLVVNVPTSGDYVIVYATKNAGTFEFVFRAKEASMIFIGLGPDGEASDVGVVPTTITLEESNGENFGGTTVVFSRPGNAKTLSEVTTLQAGTTGSSLLVAPPSGVSVVVLIKGGETQASSEGGTTVVEISEETINPVIPPVVVPVVTSGTVVND